MSAKRQLIGVTVWVAVWLSLPFGAEDILPNLRHVAEAAWRFVCAGQLPADMLASLARVSLGIGLATALVIAIALLKGLHPHLADALLAPLEFVRSVPPIAIAPVLIGALGVGGVPAVAVVAFGAFFPIYQGMLLGFSSVRKDHVEVAAAFGASTWVRLLHVDLPTMRAPFLHGLTTGVGIGWFCVIAAEMLGASSGLGFRLQNLMLNLDSSGAWSYILAIAVVGRLMLAGTRRLEARFAPWHAAEGMPV